MTGILVGVDGLQASDAASRRRPDVAVSTVVDAVVVGSCGHGGFRGLLPGPVSHHLAHHATAAVVVVPLVA